MLKIETTIDRARALTLRPPKTLSEAVAEAWIYSMSGVPPHAQDGMKLAQALIYARQNALSRPSRDEVQRSLMQSLRP